MSKGFTLIELIVVIIIVSIVLLVITSNFMPKRSINSPKSHSEVQDSLQAESILKK